MTLCWQQLDDFLVKHHLQDRPLVVALSGGVDSIGLFLLSVERMRHTGKSFSAVHVNHGLSANAEHWQTQVANLCHTEGIELKAISVNIVSKSRTSLEQQAREARYQAIAQNAAEQAVVLTGHHLQDQSETFMLRLMRSSGLAGLTSMREVNDFPHQVGREKQLKLARPLLNTDKNSIIDYVIAQQQEWVEDESNQSEQFDRNFLRRSIFPVMRSRWQNIDKRIKTSTELLQQEHDLLQEYVEQDHLACLETGFLEQKCMSIPHLKARSYNKQSAILRMFVNKSTGVYPSRKVLKEIFSSVITAAGDQQPMIRVGAFYLRRHQDLIYVVKDQPETTFDEMTLTINQTLELPQTSCYQSIEVNMAKPAGDWSIKWGRMTDKLRLNPKTGSKQVKTLLKERGCPPWLRHRMPLLYCNEHLIAVADFVIDYQYASSVTIKLR